MKNKKLLKKIICALIGVSFLVACKQEDPDSIKEAGHEEIKNVNVSALDQIEVSHLAFIREEENLARDVYARLAREYPEQTVFEQFAVNNVYESIGEVFREVWGLYFSKVFNELISDGFESELEALYAGAYIEELEINDIVVCPEVMVANGYPYRCGLQYTKDQNLKKAYTKLVRGAEYHLRAFVGQIEAIEGLGTYKAQYLEQKEVDTILGR